MEWTLEHEEGYQDAAQGEPLFPDAAEYYREGWIRYHADNGADMTGLNSTVRRDQD